MRRPRLRGVGVTMGNWIQSDSTERISAGDEQEIAKIRHERECRRRDVESEMDKMARLRAEIEALQEAPTKAPAGTARVVAERVEIHCHSLHRDIVAFRGSIIYPSTVPFPAKNPMDGQHRFLVSASVFSRLKSQGAIQ